MTAGAAAPRISTPRTLRLWRLSVNSIRIRSKNSKPISENSNQKHQADAKPMRVIGATLIIIATLLVSGCQTVHQEDLASWEGAPVSDLDTHPIFITIPMVRTVTSDGTEIRNYINGASVGSCSGGGGVYTGVVSMATYQQFSSCMARFAACHGIFYIKDGRVVRATAIGTGGARCYTNETFRPGFRGPANIM